MKSKTIGWMAALSFCLTAEAMACSAFVLHKGDECVMGFNENWGGEAPGFVLLNQPGRAKRGVTDAEWTGGAALSAEPAIRWTSRYGSLTFNCFGKDSPSFGVNEKGLMVAELGCGYPAKPSPPLLGERPLAMAVWVQYVLDRFSGVDEALEDIAASRLAVQCGTHQFFLADSSGRAGAIMFDAQGLKRGINGSWNLFCLLGIEALTPSSRKASRQEQRFRERMALPVDRQGLRAA